MPIFTLKIKFYNANDLQIRIHNQFFVANNQL